MQAALFVQKSQMACLKSLGQRPTLNPVPLGHRSFEQQASQFDLHHFPWSQDHSKPSLRCAVFFLGVRNAAPRPFQTAQLQLWICLVASDLSQAENMVHMGSGIEMSVIGAPAIARQRAKPFEKLPHLRHRCFSQTSPLGIDSPSPWKAFIQLNVWAL
jgi:hypothetical protein